MKFTVHTHPGGVGDDGVLSVYAEEPVTDREAYALALKAIFSADRVEPLRGTRYVVILRPSVMLATGQRYDDWLDEQIPDEFRHD